jgi:hypothetical protein
MSLEVDGGLWSASRSGRVTHHPGEITRYTTDKRLSGHHVRSESCGPEKRFLLLPGLEPQLSSPQPTVTRTETGEYKQGKVRLWAQAFMLISWHYLDICRKGRARTTKRPSCLPLVECRTGCAPNMSISLRLVPPFSVKCVSIRYSATDLDRLCGF